jgi:hypothetical protein
MDINDIDATDRERELWLKFKDFQQCYLDRKKVAPDRKVIDFGSETN